MRATTLSTMLFALVLVGCDASAPAETPPVTGLVVAIDYAGAVASVTVTGTAQSSGRTFGPYVLPASQLASGGTIGFIFDDSDSGAMICATTKDGFGDVLDESCHMFPVHADQIMDGTLTLDSPGGTGPGGTNPGPGGSGGSGGSGGGGSVMPSPPDMSTPPDMTSTSSGGSGGSGGGGHWPFHWLKT